MVSWKWKLVSVAGQLDFYRLFCKNDEREVVMEEIDRVQKEGYSYQVN